MKDHYWKQELTFSPFHSLCISRVTLNTKSHKMQKDAKQRLRYKKQYKYCRLPTDMWKVLWAAVLCCLVLSKWRSINEVTAYQKQYFSEFTVKFSVWKLEWCLCAGVTVGVVVVFADKSMKRGKPAICETLLVLKLSARAGHRFSGVYVVDVWSDTELWISDDTHRAGWSVACERICFY